MFRKFLLSLLAALFLLSPALAAELTILHTTDLHGYVDAWTNRQGKLVGGLAQLSKMVIEERKKDPELLLLDAGDTIQGNAMAFYFKGKHIIDAMNYLGYDAMAIGNHEFNFGLDVLEARRKQSHFPWLCANIVYTDGSHLSQPSLIRTVKGVKVGIIGLCVHNIPNWEQPDYIAGLKFNNIVDVAKAEVKRLRPEVDVLVVLMHSGVEPRATDDQSDPGGEASGAIIAKACPEVDVIICGHAHVTVESKMINGVLLTEAGNWTSHLGKVNISVDDGKISAKTARLFEILPNLPKDPGIEKVLKPYREEFDKWAATEIGAIGAPLDFRNSQRTPTSGVSFIHKAIKDATSADITFHVAFNASTTIPAGPVTNQQVFEMYYYDNALWVLELTGRQIREALEVGAANIGTWKFLTAGGINYTIDASKPVGSRITHISLADGRPFEPDKSYSVAVNHYNAVGGGGMDVLKGASKITKTGKWVRESIADYIRKQPGIIPEPVNNWRIINLEKTP